MPNLFKRVIMKSIHAVETHAAVQRFLCSCFCFVICCSKKGYLDKLTFVRLSSLHVCVCVCVDRQHVYVTNRECPSCCKVNWHWAIKKQQSLLRFTESCEPQAINSSSSSKDAEKNDYKFALVQNGLNTWPENIFVHDNNSNNIKSLNLVLYIFAHLKYKNVYNNLRNYYYFISNINHLQWTSSTCTFKLFIL